MRQDLLRESGSALTRTFVWLSLFFMILLQIASLGSRLGCALTIAVVIVSSCCIRATALAMRNIFVPFSVFKNAADNGSASRQNQARQQQQEQSECGFHCFSNSSETFTCIGSIASILSPSVFYHHRDRYLSLGDEFSCGHCIGGHRGDLFQLGLKSSQAYLRGRDYHFCLLWNIPRYNRYHTDLLRGGCFYVSCRSEGLICEMVIPGGT